MHRWWVVIGLVGCGPREVLDNGDPCFTMPASLPGTVEVTVTAFGGEQRPEDGTCVVEDVDGEHTLTTSFFYDRDRTPFSELSILTFSSASCSFTAEGADPVVVVYVGEEISLPVDGAEHCFAVNHQTGEVVPVEPTL